MKQYQINAAYAATMKLNGCELPVKIAHDIYMLRCSLEPHYRFAADRDRKLLKKYDGKINSDGMAVFENEENAVKFYEELDAGNNLDIDLKVDVVTIPYSDLEQIKMTPNDMAALEGLIEFV